MGWIPIVAWSAAAVVALVVLGYCAYEVSWKAKRLQRDLAELTALNGELTGLRDQLVEIRTRLAAAAPSQ